MKPSEPNKAIAEGPLVAMCACLVLAALPIAGLVPPFAMAFFLVAVAARLAMQHWRLRLPGAPFKLMVLCVGLGGTIVSTGTLLGIEATMGSLLILIALKLFETKAVRDFQFLGVAGWFLGLCGLFFAQDLVRWIYVGSVCAVIGVTLVQFHRGPGRGTLRRSMRLTATIGLQALPMVVLLFITFPRSYGGFRFAFGRALQDGSGISDSLEPGSVASIVMNEAIAFRVDFPDGIVPPQSQMYWRGGVLWRGDGLNWGRIPDLVSERNRVTLEGPPIRQRFMVEPHGGLWLFALDRPVVPRSFLYDAGGALRSHKPIHITQRYDVTSRPTNREPDLHPRQRQEALVLPSQLSPQLAALVASWRSAEASDREVVANALRWFRSENFSYTLSPGTYEGPGALDEFLFRRRAGFCEHYAGAFASLMRVAGIPSRIVVGYHGGEFNRLGNYVIVRQSEAHAWSEVHIEGEGWMRVDPTEVIAPDRLTLGIESLLGSAGGGPGGDAGIASGTLGLRGLLRDLRFAWDNLNYQWDLRIVGFDDESQRELFTGLGLPRLHWVSYAAWGLLIVAPLLGALALWLRRPARTRRDPVVASWTVFCRALAKAGVARAPSEGPRTFTERAAAALPQRGDDIRRLGTLYIDARYARHATPSAEFVRAVRAFDGL